MNKLFFIIMTLFGLICPVFADDGLVQYECSAGTYLPMKATECATCLVGKYCNGGTFSYSAYTAQGIETCSNTYSGTTSDAGATSVSDCYKDAICPTITSNTNCDTHAGSCEYTNDVITSGRFYPETGTITASCNLTFTCAMGYTMNAVSVPLLPSTSAGGNDRQYRSEIYPGGTNSNADNDLAAGEWKVSWTSGSVQGVMKGVASCNNVPGMYVQSRLPANSDLVNNNTDGYYCWCKATSWIPSGKEEQILSADWVFRSGHKTESDCRYNCAIRCSHVANTKAIRTAIFDSINTSQCLVNTYVCDPGYYLPADGIECAVCPNDNYCVGGTFQYNHDEDQGIVPCPNSWKSPRGMRDVASCGRILHVGDAHLYLRSVKKTTPALHVRDSDNNIFYGSMTTMDVPMDMNTIHKLKIRNMDTIYSVYDDSVNVPQE